MKVVLSNIKGIEKRIRAIKEIRAATGLDLVDSKKIVDELLNLRSPSLRINLKRTTLREFRVVMEDLGVKVTLACEEERKAIVDLAREEGLEEILKIPEIIDALHDHYEEKLK